MLFKALLKKQFKETFGVFVMRGSKGKKKKGLGIAGFIILYAFCFISLMFAFWGMSTALADAILPMEGVQWLYYSLLCLMALALSVIGSAFSSYASLYKARDNELLLALPIPPVYLLLTRMIVVFALGLLFESIVLIPGIIVYWIKVGPTVLNVICPILVMILLAFIALTLSCILGWLVALVASKVKNKNAGTVIFTLVFLGCYYIFYFNAQKILQNILANVGNYKFAMHFAGSAATGEILSLLIFAVITAAVFAATCYVLSKSFIKIVTKHSVETKKTYNRNQELKQSSVGKALLKKELKHFVNSPAYMLNSGLGILLMPATAIVLWVKSSSIAPLLSLLPKGFFEILIVSVLVAFTSVNTISSPSISLEGKNYWLVRSLPIETYGIINAKIQLHEILTIPPAFITAAILCGIYRVEFTLIIDIFALIYLAIVLEAQIGIALNLKMPNMTWSNEAVPIKRSLPVAISMFGGWILSALVAVGFYLLRDKLEPTVYMLTIILVFALSSRFLGKWLRTRGVEIAEAI